MPTTSTPLLFTAGTERDPSGRSIQQLTPNSSVTKEFTRLWILACIFLQPGTSACTTHEIHHHHSHSFAVTTATPSSCHSSDSQSWGRIIWVLCLFWGFCVYWGGGGVCLCLFLFFSLLQNCYNSLWLPYHSSLAWPLPPSVCGQDRECMRQRSMGTDDL